MRRFACVCLVALALACSSKKPVADSGTPDEDAGEDAGQTCGPSKDVTTADVGAGFLPPTEVPFLFVTDGDTAHFTWKGADRTFRFLFVNTEESSGAEMTAFGQASREFVKGWFDQAKAAGKKFEVAPQEDPGRPGQANEDPYNRILSLVFVDGVLAQQRLLREGWSAYYTLFGCPPEPIGTALLLSEKEAREAQLGVWAPGHPTDYAQVLAMWTAGKGACRPNPFLGQPYCP